MTIKMNNRRSHIIVRLGKRGKISDVFENPSVNGADNLVQSSMFDRPGFGSVAFRRR